MSVTSSAPTPTGLPAGTSLTRGQAGARPSSAFIRRPSALQRAAAFLAGLAPRRARRRCGRCGR